MLTWLRSKTGSLMVKGLLGLLVASFAVWGIGDIFTTGGPGAVATVGDTEVPGERYADSLIRLPKVPVLLQPLVSVVPLQIFACELAKAKGYDVDQPRNLAKSVTVE